MTYVGASIPGRNNRRSAAGAATYIDDIRPEGCLAMAVVRSPHAHARIRSVDTSAVHGLDGVALVLTGDELRDAGVAIQPSGTNVNFTPRTAVRYVLAVDKVRYVGEPVVAVVARDYVTAHAAVQAVLVAYETLPALGDARAALKPDAVLVEESWPDNVMVDYPIARGDADAVLAATPPSGRTSGTLVCNRVAATPLEGRGIIADYNPYDETMTCWASTQAPHVLRALLSAALSFPEGNLRVIQPQVGGAFGGKIPMFPEDVITAYASRRLGRPVKWIEQRHEYLSAGGHSRDMRCDYEVGFEPDGRITALKADLLADIGAQSTFLGWLMAIVSAACMPGSYVVDHVSIRLRAVVSNRGPWQAYRGYGKEVAAFFMERILDDVARACGLGRDAVRTRNFISPSHFPYIQPSGWVTDSGDYQGTLEAVKELIGWDDFPARQTAARTDGRYLGIGIGHELTPEGSSRPDALLNGTDSATVKMTPRGDVTVLTGVTSPGSGNETGIAQIVAECLGADLDRVRVLQGDTQSAPHGNGNYSSRSLTFGGSSARLAALVIREKLEIVAERMLNADRADLEVTRHRIRSRASGQSVTFDEVAAEIYRKPHGRHMAGIDPALEATRAFKIDNVYHRKDEDGRYNQYPTWSFSTGACIVEVIPETGEVRIEKFALVHDCGVVVNPLLAEAQLHGAIMQGIGASLYEEIVYDDDANPQTPTLREYTLPGIRESVDISLGHRSTPSPFTFMGMKGVGESGISAPGPAIASAIDDALAEFGVRMTTMPFTPVRVWEAIQIARGE
ncbi:aldehyde dehydrogenase [Acrocarpospora pleiomorpha]|uniref:Aldehyde dehydrogenase n=1 Tax=Acrocarpospora pleiomorpha TaxID=90975 RepID=A0A5M3Y0Z9_9ACTN|nr:xanthine dehydrogenase family protein molybdopterin-binding subunit [Acrocarpospora pleiomorpha]GES24378.1 aldehyde dehydrogenase [Acrocarpospora pleiomorpha]